MLVCFRLCGRPGAWSSAGVAHWSPRYYHSAVGLADGTTLMLGGCDSKGGYFTDLWRTSSSTGGVYLNVSEITDLSNGDHYF
jgi:hypothetical protein